MEGFTVTSAENRLLGIEHIGTGKEGITFRQRGLLSTKTTESDAVTKRDIASGEHWSDGAASSLQMPTFCLEAFLVFVQQRSCLLYDTLIWQRGRVVDAVHFPVTFCTVISYNVYFNILPVARGKELSRKVMHSRFLVCRWYNLSMVVEYSNVRTSWAQWVTGHSQPLRISWLLEAIK